MSMSKSSRMLKYVNYRMRITLQGINVIIIIITTITNFYINVIIM
jgi:hypothetical protein